MTKMITGVVRDSSDYKTGYGLELFRIIARHETIYVEVVDRRLDVAGLC
jgi:hypothetical protein